MVERLETRTNNPYGKSPLEFSRFLEDVEAVEPLLRRAADREVRTSALWTRSWRRSCARRR